MELNIKQLNQKIKPLGMGCWAIGGVRGPKDLQNEEDIQKQDVIH